MEGRVVLPGKAAAYWGLTTCLRRSASHSSQWGGGLTPLWGGCHSSLGTLGRERSGCCPRPHASHCQRPGSAFSLHSQDLGLAFRGTWYVGHLALLCGTCMLQLCWDQGAGNSGIVPQRCEQKLEFSTEALSEEEGSRPRGQWEGPV